MGNGMDEQKKVCKDDVRDGEENRADEDGACNGEETRDDEQSRVDEVPDGKEGTRDDVETRAEGASELIKKPLEEMTSKEIGTRGEKAACEYLKRRGYKILEKNWRCSSGEADIIVSDEDTLVFVEVKTRTSEIAGLPEEAITKAKKRKYESIALAYLCDNDIGSISVRFDVISITLITANKAFLRHHLNAFGCEA